MAEGGSLAGSVKGSDAIYDYKCSDCLSRNGTYTEAVFYCPECNKYNCRQCYVCDHDVIGRRSMDRWGHPFMTKVYETGEIQTVKKRSCDIPLVTNENKAGLKKVSEGLGELHLKADKVSKDKAINLTVLTDLDQTEQRLTTSINQLQADALPDDIEEKSLDDIEVETLFKYRCKSELDICGKIKTEVNDLEMELDSASTDDSLLFSRIKQGKGQVRDKNSSLSDITSSESFDKADFKDHTEREHLLMRLQGLEELHTDSSVDIPPSPWSGEVKHGYNQSLASHSVTANKSYRIVKNTSFDVKTEYDKNTCDIWGMCMMPSGHLILADYYNKSLKKVSSQYEVTGRCPMSAAPRDICHTEADQVAVALYSYSVQLVTVSGSMSCTSSFSTDHACHRLAYSNKCLYIITYRGTAVYVYNLAGIQLRVVTQDQHGNQLFSDTRCITTSRDGERLHITDENGLVTMDTRGNLITRFTSDELIDGPFSLCTDGDGNVYVGGRSSNNLLQVGGEANKKLAELLSDSGGIEVQSLCFDGVHARLLVSSWDSDTVHVLHLST